MQCNQLNHTRLNQHFTSHYKRAYATSHTCNIWDVSGLAFIGPYRTTMATCSVLTHGMPEPVQGEVLLQRPLVQDDVDGHTSGGGRVQVKNDRVVCQLVRHHGDYLQNTAGFQKPQHTPSLSVTVGFKCRHQMLDCVESLANILK